MSQTERFYAIDDLLQRNRFVTRQRFLDELRISRASFNRDIRHMRERLFAPIEYDTDQEGYYLDKLNPQYRRYQLPGLWFDAREIHAMLTLQRYFQDVSPSLLGDHLEPLREKLDAVMKGSKFAGQDVAEKIKIIHLHRRVSRNEHFDKVAHALMSSRRVEIRYYSRPHDSYSDREVSPLRLVHYRENWYLDAWCHKANALRIFAVDAIHEARLTEKTAQAIDRAAHDRHVTAGYGIFSGEDIQWAKLRFSVERSRWVAPEEWHPLQVQTYDEEYRSVLQVPYSIEHELVMDILKYGPDVEVLAPPQLREQVRARLAAALGLYGPGGSGSLGETGNGETPPKAS